MINLHTHTEHSYKDAISKIRDIALKEKELGYNTFCITDHGTMGGFPEAFSVAKELKMKFIPGFEAYLTPPADIDKRNNVLSLAEVNKILRRKTVSIEERKVAQDKFNILNKVDSKKNFHLTLLSYNPQGLDNLFKIYSEGELYSKYRISKESLFNHKEGIIVLSGCFGGELAFYIMSKQNDKAKKLILEYKEAFGKNYYIEIMYHGLEQYPKDKEKGYLGEIEVSLKMIELAVELGVPLVATNDAHYLNAEDGKMHDIYKSMCYNKTEEQKNGESIFSGTGYYIVSEDQLKSRFQKVGYTNIESMFNNVNVIADTVEENIDIKRAKPLKDSKEELYKLVVAGWEKLRKGTAKEKESLKRFTYELEIINSKNFSHYFINIRNIVKRAYDLGILTGPGRGSGAGSEVVFLLEITKTDPLKYGLIFERFLNPGRKGMPDIDEDFEAESSKYKGRQASDVVVQSLEDIYPFHGQIGNVITGSSLVLFKKLASYYGVIYSEANKFTTSDIGKEILSLKETPGKKEFINILSQLGVTLTEAWEKVIEDIAICYRLDGLVFGTGIHASGVIMSEENVILPINNSNKVINFNGSTLEGYGFIKNDLLSVDALSPIKDIYGLNVNWDDTEDEKVWATLRAGESDFVFQLASAGMKDMLINGHVKSIEQLAEINAIYRPGPLGMGMNKTWIDVQNGNINLDENDTVIYGLLKEHFGNEHSGLLIFQEDVMAICVDGAGFTLTESDDIRRAMGHKIKKLMDSFEGKFISGWETGKFSGNAKEIWEKLKTFAEYAFNKSHAVSYVQISYQTAKLWTYNREEYLQWIINHGTKDRRNKAMQECKQLGYNINFPTYNNTVKNEGYTVTEDKVIVPTSINADFDCLSDFIFSSMSTIEKLKLILSGAMDKAAPDRQGFCDLIKAIPNKMNDIPNFPSVDSLSELARNGELIGLWTYENKENIIKFNVKRPKSQVKVEIYKNKTYFPDWKLEFNIKQDMKFFSLLKPNQLSIFPKMDTNKLFKKLYNVREKLMAGRTIAEILENGKKEFYDIKKLLSLELKKSLMDDMYKNKIKNFEEEEYIVMFDSNTSYPGSDYSKAVFTFDDGNHLFYVRDTDVIEKLQSVNKKSICRLSVKLNTYMNKNLEPIALFALKDFYQNINPEIKIAAEKANMKLEEEKLLLIAK